MEEVVRAFRPDLVHLHNIYHQLSPSILGPLRHRAIPSVMTLHDYKLACPTYRFLDHGEICEACVPRRFHQAVLHRCNGGSLGASAVNAIEMTLHTLSNAYGTVRAFLCPSRFLMEKMQAARVFPERLRWVPNFVDVSSIEVKSLPGGGAAYAGRLSPEKGIDVLIDAVGRIGAELDIAGDGPDRGALERLAATKAPGRVRFHGRLTADGVHALFREAAAVVLPSRWHENQPLAVLESFACGVPVIGTALGGIPELIEPGRTGDIVPPNDAEALGASLARLLGDPPSALRMGQAARSRAERDFTPGVHLARVEQVYAEVMEGTPS
jgi:glycosyltransferase involved in cell wall biosynthesis